MVLDVNVFCRIVFVIKVLVGESCLMAFVTEVIAAWFSHINGTV
jgi:hypothetical protein